MSVVVWTCILVATITCALTYVYVEVYRRSQERSVERMLTRYYSGPEDDSVDGDGDDGDVVAKRDKIMRLRRRMGVDIGSLPVVRFEAEKRDGSRESERDDGDGNDDDAARKRETELRLRRQDCLTSGYYLGPDDDYVDCRSVCGTSDGVSYRYYDKLGTILNGRKGRIGAYCVPNDAAACNSNTSAVLYTKHGWRCIPQTRAFAGEGGNRVIVCNGSLLDRATGKIWRDHIDPTLTFESIDKKLPNEGGYRFVCPPGITDDVGNELIPAPFDRLLLLRNVCSMLIPYAQTDKIYPNFEAGSCVCYADVSSYDSGLGTCVPYDQADDVFRATTLEAAVRPTTVGKFSELCVETWSTVSDLEAIAGEDWQNLFPCGIESDSEFADKSAPACAMTYALAYDRALPSPYMMLEASSKIKKL